MSFSGYCKVLPRRPRWVPQPQTQMIMHYKDDFGRSCKFICCAPLNQHDQGQSTDIEVKHHMQRLGIQMCRVEYRDWQWDTHKWFTTSASVPREARPRRKRRTVKL